MFSFRIIRRPAPANVQIETIRSEIVKAVTPIAKQHVAERERITSHFSHKPEWDYRINVQSSGLQILILLKNASSRVSGRVTMATLLEWLFVTGTKAHLIAAKPGKVLSFMWGGPGSYNRITPLGRSGPGSGEITGAQQVVRRYVAHPGFPPSPALGHINQKLGGALTRAFRLGVGNGLRRK